MPLIPFGNFQPDVVDYEGRTSIDVTNVLPRGDGYGPFANLLAYTTALPRACRGFFYARKSDGSIQVFACTSTEIYSLSNSTFAWAPVSKVAAVTSITNASPAVVNYTAHGKVAGDPVVFSTSGALPTGLTAGTTYYVISAGLTANAFEVSATLGGSAINTSGAGSGTHSVTNLYTSVSSGAQWQFAQFNNYVIAVQQNTAPQVYDLTSSTAFADLAGSPPQAGAISIVNRFIVLSNLTSNAYRIQWSGLNATTTWTSGVTQSDFQDLPDGGLVRGMAGGEFGVIFQDASIRRMTFAPGSPYVFGIDRISEDDGVFAQFSIINAGDRIFFCSPQGFKMLLPGGYPQSIGKEKVDRTFFADVDTGNLQLMIGAHDPRVTRVYWAYKSKNGTNGFFDKILCYDWMLDRWTTSNVSGEYLGSLSKPGITLENIDTAFGSNIDTITLSSFDDISTASISTLAAIDSTHKLGFFTGANLEATIESSEQGTDSRRLVFRGVRPITDCATAAVSVSSRENLQTSPTYSAETSVNAQGYCPRMTSGRYSRIKLRNPAGATWTYASGVEPDIVTEGRR